MYFTYQPALKDPWNTPELLQFPQEAEKGPVKGLCEEVL